MMHPSVVRDPGLKRAQNRSWLWAGCFLIGASKLVAAGTDVSDTSTNASDSTLESPAAYKRLSLEELMNLDVTSVSRAPQPYGQAPAAIDVITSEDIQRSGASSIPEALRLADNLEVAQKSSSSWGISARGFNTDLANKLLVQIDGRSVYTPLYSGVFWDVQDYLLKDIDRIEVISGPGGTLWGANAVNGVINITTKSAQDTQGLYTEAGGGNWLQDFGAFRYGGTLATNVYYRVYAKYFDRDSEVLANGNRANDDWRMGQGGFRIDSVAQPQNPLTLQGDFYMGDEGVETGGRARTGGGNLLGRWTHDISDDSDLQLLAYYDRTHLSSPTPAYVLPVGGVPVTLAPAGTLTDDLDTFNVDFQHRFALWNRNQVVWGLGYRFTHEVDGNAPSVAFLPPTLNQTLLSAFAQDEIRLIGPTYLTLGSKLEHNDYTGVEVEPNARLRWNITPQHMVWAAVSRAVRTPSRIDRDLSQPGPSAPLVILEGSSEFESETLIAYEAGYRAQVSSRLNASVSAFYNDYNDIRSTAFNPVTFLPFAFQNDLEGDTYGTEVSATYQVCDGWRLHAGYDLLKETIHVKPGGVDINDALNETADPQQQFSVRSSLDLGSQVQLDGGLRWVDTLHNNSGTTVGTVPSYFELDARLAWRVTKDMEVSIVGQNLLHDQHPEYGYPDASREEIVRSVFGKVAWQF